MKLLALVVAAILGFWIVSALMERGRQRPAVSSESSSDRHSNPSESDGADPVERARKVLGLGPRFTSSELRAAYRLSMSQYHPDKVAALGPELRELAERKTKEINTAVRVLQHHSS
jgi:DnaJ-domain-containing protein 1